MANEDTEGRPLLFTCCHEAGHAIIGVLIGYKPAMMVAGRADALARMTQAQRELYQQKTHGNIVLAAIFWEPKAQPTCKCGCEVKQTAATMYQRRFYPHEELLCDCCLDFCVREVAVHLAGGIATQVIMKMSPKPLEVKDDNDKANTFLVELNDELKTHILRGARSLAEKLLNEQRKAVIAVRDALNRELVLDGSVVVHLITENVIDQEPSGSGSDWGVILRGGADIWRRHGEQQIFGALNCRIRNTGGRLRSGYQKRS